VETLREGMAAGTARVGERFRPAWPLQIYGIHLLDSYSSGQGEACTPSRNQQRGIIYTTIQKRRNFKPLTALIALLSSRQLAHCHVSPIIPNYPCHE
jgi:hypothetical protein